MGRAHVSAHQSATRVNVIISKFSLAMHATLKLIDICDRGPAYSMATHVRVIMQKWIACGMRTVTGHRGSIKCDWLAHNRIKNVADKTCGTNQLIINAEILWSLNYRNWGGLDAL